MWERFSVFSGSSGNLGMLFRPFSGTHRNDFLSEWPICLLGDCEITTFTVKLLEKLKIKLCIKSLKNCARRIPIAHLLRMPERKKTHVRGVLLDFVLVGVLSGDLSPPEAVLAQVVVVALLAPVPEPAEVVPLARVAHHRVRHCKHFLLFSLSPRRRSFKSNSQ